MGARVAEQLIDARAARNIRKQYTDFAMTGHKRSKINPPGIDKAFLGGRLSMVLGRRIAGKRRIGGDGCQAETA
jgi:hypothetical protein